MELPVYQIDGTESGRTVQLDSVLTIAPNDHVLWLDVRRTQASRHQGTHKTKERGEVRGSTRKLYRQKGTGMARSGSITSPIRRSGGRTFGPRPRRYGLRLSKKTRRLARASALSYKVQHEALRVVEPLRFSAPNTRRLLNLVHDFGLERQRVLVVTGAHAPAVHRSAANLSRVDVKEARSLCAEDILRARVLLLEEAALDVLQAALRSAVRGAAAAALVAEPAATESVAADAATTEATAAAAKAETVAIETAEPETAEPETVAMEAADTEAAAEGSIAAEADALQADAVQADAETAVSAKPVETAEVPAASDTSAQPE